MVNNKPVKKVKNKTIKKQNKKNKYNKQNKFKASKSRKFKKIIFGGGPPYTNFPLEALDDRLFGKLFINKDSFYKSSINKSKIRAIEYERFIAETVHEKNIPPKTKGGRGEEGGGGRYEPVSTSGERNNKFRFFIHLKDVSDPITIVCDDSRKKMDGTSDNSSVIHSYRWNPLMGTPSDDPKIYVLIKNMTLDNASWMLQHLSAYLGIYINAHIVEIGEKITNETSCPIMQTDYTTGCNIILFFPCLHCVSQDAYDNMQRTQFADMCSLCIQRINSTQLLSYEDYIKISDYKNNKIGTTEKDESSGGGGGGGGGES